MRSLIFLVLTVQLISAAKHSLQYFYAGVTPGPDFTLVGLLDGEEFVYYDSNIRKMIPKTDWIKKIDADDPQYWDRNTQWAQRNQEDFKISLDIAMQLYNHKGGVHMLQRMYGCVEDDGTKTGYDLYGYDGEDFISLDLNTGTWTAANAKAVTTKQKWEETYTAANVKDYLLNECPEELKKYVRYSRSTPERKVRPEVSLFQKDLSSPVVCHATGIYPKPVKISWKKNGEDLDEGVDLRETLPNQDGTFQRRSILTVSPGELEKHNYTCIIQHSSLEKEMVLLVSDRRVPPVPPEVSLFQKNSSSPVVCQATGFYPKAVMISWKKNGEDLHEGVELRETQPNQDGTFQKRSILTVSPEELDKHNYTCIIQHISLEKEMVLQVSDHRVPTGRGRVGIIISVGLLLVITVCAGVFMWKKNQSGFKCVLGNPSARGISVGTIIGAVLSGLQVVIVGCVGVFIWIKNQSGFIRVLGNPSAPSEGDPASTSSNSGPS